MKHISVIVPVGSSVVDTIIAPYNMFRMANSHYKKISDNKEAFRIDLVGLSKDPVRYQGLFSIQPTATIEEVSKTDLIIVSPISGDLALEIDNNRDFVQWIKTQRM